MSNINAIFAGMTGHPTHAASSLSFHIVHLSPNASNWWTTFLCPSLIILKILKKKWHGISQIPLAGHLKISEKK